MKSTIISLTIAAFTLIAAAPKAEAHSHANRIYISGYTSCGAPIYTERYFIGYDHCGNPIWGHRTIRPAYRERPRYVTHCPPPVYYGPGRCHGGGTRVVIQGSFGRY
ncbi:MAG: hypothetical protein ABI162_09180 [Luteolibacter sp.]